VLVGLRCAPRFEHGHPHPERRLLRDGLREREGAVELLTGRHHLLNEADAVRLGGVELVAREDPAHRVAPTGLAGEADGRAAEGEDPAFDLELRESRRLGGDAHVARERELDADGHADALQRANDRLVPHGSIKTQWIDGAVSHGEPSAREGRRHLDEVEPTGEVVSVREEHPHPRGRVLLQGRVRLGELFVHRRIEGVAFLDAVEAHQQDVTTPFDRDAGLAHARERIASSTRYPDHVMTDPVAASVRAVVPRVIEQRRDFHRHPELGFEEVRTSGKVVEWCKALGLETANGIGRTGVIARLRGARPGKTVALRADMDALPIQEANQHDFQSTVPGKMHACGHDAHTAMLLGVASALTEHRDRIAGEVRFLFQPAEEGLGGAVPMIDAGALEGVDLVLGQHMGPTHPTGVIAVSQGPAMAATDFFTLKILGRGGHGAYPHLAIDTIPVAAQVIGALQTIVSRTVDPLQAAVVTIGTIKGGFRSNVIAPEVEMTGTVRTFDQGLRESMPLTIERIVRGIVDAHGARHVLDYTMNYPSVINDDDATQLLKAAAAEIVGQDHVKVIPPSMGGEDFAYYAERVPACFYWLGCRHPGLAESPNIHSPDFDLDEDSLEIGMRVMARAALRFLGG